ncbi:MAG: site-specific integrase [Bacteroidota bacterium]|nr:site-specific integrase [Bacteroidota bacterium]
MRTTFNTLFFLKKSGLKKDGTMPIMARITINGTVAHFSTKLCVPPEKWDMATNRVKGSTRETKEINYLLSEIQASLSSYFHDLQRRDGIVTAKALKNEFLGISENHVTVLSLFKTHNDNFERQVGISKSKATFQKYQRTYNHIEAFIKKEYNVEDMPLRSINNLFITGFETYMRVDKKCCHNTTAKYIQLFKSIILIARKNGLLLTDPFADYQIRFQKVDRGYLTEDELKAILEKKFTNKRLEQVRDVFLFSCFTGLAYIDVKNLKKENIRKSFDGNLWIMTKRQKTNVQSNVLLLDIPLKILEKYEGKLPNDKILPVSSNQKMNAYLKEIGTLCNIDKDLTFHLARHTFATTVTLAKGVPIESVSKMLGHTKMQTTQIYARITNEKISRDMSELSKKLTALNKAVNL